MLLTQAVLSLALASPVLAVGGQGTFEFLILLSFINGLLLTLLFTTSPRLRVDRGARVAALLSVILGASLFILGTPEAEFVKPGFRLLGVAALSGYGIVLAYLLASTLGQFVAPWLSNRQLARYHSLSPRRRVRLLEPRVVREPTDPWLRRSLVDAYTELGDHESATYHAYVWVELLPRGKSHMLALYRICQILVERRQQLQAAQPHLRRLIRVYPRSYFASYARRIVNHYEAYADHEI